MPSEIPYHDICEYFDLTAVELILDVKQFRSLLFKCTYGSFNYYISGFEGVWDLTENADAPDALREGGLKSKLLMYCLHISFKGSLKIFLSMFD